MNNSILFESLCRHIGETVTIFTASGGISGSGFTGVLAAVDGCSVKLICSFSSPPSCPLGSACNGFGNRGNRCGCGNNLGSVTVIPIDKIVSFTHNAL